MSLTEKTNQIEGQVTVTVELQTEIEGLKEKQEGAAQQRGEKHISKCDVDWFDLLSLFSDILKCVSPSWLQLSLQSSLLSVTGPAPLRVS